MTHTKIIVTNPTRKRKWGWGYSVTPTGQDAWSIKAPDGPDYTGTFASICRRINDDRTYQAFRSGGTYMRHQWFYDGKPIVNEHEVLDGLWAIKDGFRDRPATITVFVED